MPAGPPRRTSDLAHREADLQYPRSKVTRRRLEAAPGRGQSLQGGADDDQSTRFHQTRHNGHVDRRRSAMTARRDLVVRAPTGSVAWAALYGWVLDPGDVPTVHRSGDLVLLVEPSGHITGLSGPAPLAALVRVDRDVQELAARLDRILALIGEVANEGVHR